MRAKCLVEGCENKSSARGHCNIHYQRLIRGVPMDGNPQKSVMQRIMEKVDKKENGCWMWTGAKSGGPPEYGYIAIKNGKRIKATRVHRLMWEIKHQQKIPAGMNILHDCDEPLCVNPDHLTLGTHRDNMHDMISKNRSRHPCGEANHSVLSEKQVLRMKELNRSGYPFTLLSQFYAVHPTTVKNICTGKNWKHLIETKEEL